MGGCRKTGAECDKERAEESHRQCEDEQEEKTRRDSSANLRRGDGRKGAQKGQEGIEKGEEPFIASVALMKAL
jgi:hypothetical protein